jgi:hypothetical protein
MVLFMSEVPVLPLERVFSAPEFSIFAFQMVLFVCELPVFSFELSVCLLEAAVLGLEGVMLALESRVLAFKTLHLTLQRGVELFFASEITDFEFSELSAARLGRGSNVAGSVHGGSRLVTMAAAVVFVVFAVFTMFVVVRDGLSNDRCNGSSSENECDGKFDLNHF